ncbi:MAG: sigma 54-interacting transcriptional regulator [Acidobacteriota bacterium]
MGLEFLQYSPGDTPPTFTRLEWATVRTFFTTAPRDRPVVYLIKRDDVRTLCEMEDLVKSVGTKADRKPLKYYLLERPRRGNEKAIPSINLPSSSPSQVPRSIRDFLTHAASSPERTPYILGVADNVFRDLASRSHRRRHSNPSAADAAKKKAFFLGRSEGARQVREQIARAAANRYSVIILGETGTGKEVVARAIHEQSGLEGVFTGVNCAAIPEGNFEVELFGVTGGVFTNVTGNIGLWKASDGGTLFLDEVGEMSLSHQAKCLRVLHTKSIMKVGGTVEEPVHTRIITATNCDLWQMVEEGRFRRDLFFRLQGMEIYVPPLRQCREDIEIHAQAAWRRETRDPSATLPEVLLDELCAYPWPGNVRQLRSVLRRLYANHGRDHLTTRHLREAMTPLRMPSSSSVTVPARGADPGPERLPDVLGVSRQVLDVCEAISGLMEASAGNARVLDYARFSVRTFVDLLTDLCRPADPVPRREVFFAVHRLAGVLSYLEILLHADPGRALEYWRNEGRRECELSRSVLQGK